MAKRIKLSNNKKRKIVQLLATAGHALQQHELTQCLATCEDIEKLYPDHPDVLHLQGLVAREQGELKQAATYLQQAIHASPHRADFLASLANITLQAGESDAAIVLYIQALAVDKHDVSAHLGLAGTWMQQEKHQAALELLERIQKRHPGDSAIRMGMFQACHALRQHHAARSHLEAIIARQPKHSDAHYRLAILAVEQGQLDAARRHIQHTLQINPWHADAWGIRVDLQHYDASDDDIEILMQIKQQCPTGSDADMKISFALAKVLDDIGRYEQAFSLLQEANAIRHQQHAFDNNAAVTALDHIIQTCSRERMHQPAQGEQIQIQNKQMQNKQPQDKQAQHKTCIFIVGMPRSGSTLIEQILAAHPDVTALGENGHLQAAIHAVVGSSLSPAELNSLDDAQCAEIGAIYLERIAQKDDENLYFCDKTLSHINLLGLIQRSLPQVKIIHLQRHPMDTCLSIYKNNLQGSHFGYGAKLTELKHYYAAYQRLMAHWRQVLPADTYFDITYEQLVKHQEQQTRQLLQACTLNWNPACLHFQQTKHAAQTASAIQVRQALSTRSIGLWKHYEHELNILQSLC